MIARALKAAIDRFGRTYRYDASYMKDVVDASTAGGAKLMAATQFLRHDFGLPSEVGYAARVRSVHRADCGPCLRLVLRMAEQAGVPAERLLPALDQGEAPPDVALAIRYADAVLDQSPELPEIIDAVRARFGHDGLVSLAVAVTAGQFYPLLKRGLGHAATCEPVIRELLAAHRERNLQDDGTRPDDRSDAARRVSG